jgi:alpha-D-ribose 1-methylphosphonate 5-triphosphate synthase subunit PhnG
MSTPPSSPLNRTACLSLLSQAPAVEVKDFAERLLPALQPVEVLENRAGLVMLPMVDPVQGASFYLGEALVSEAHVRITGGQAEGYAACLGRDLQQALALALIDAANAANLQAEAIAAFTTKMGCVLQEADRLLSNEVEATRVEMETFEWTMPK